MARKTLAPLDLILENITNACTLLTLELACKKNWSSGFLKRTDTNQAVQSQKKVRILKCWAEVEEELLYPCSENKGADQLCSYYEADQHLCFRTGKNLAFS